MLESLPRTYEPRVFSKPAMDLNHFKDNFNVQKKRVAQKLSNSRLNQITFKTMRHYYATLLQHRVHDIFYLMQMLGHKNIKNTQVYVHLAEELFKGETEYISKVAKSEKEALSLMDAGFDYVTDDYVTDYGVHALFRKRKY